MTKSTDHIPAALAEFIASLGLSEAEAPGAVIAAFRHLGWSENALTSQAALTKTLQAAADEVADNRVARLQARYNKRLREIILPEGGFTSKGQAAAASRLSQTYRDLSKLEAELGLPITKKDPRVGRADSLRTAFRRQQSGSATEPTHLGRSKGARKSPKP